MHNQIANLETATKQELYDAYCATRNAADRLEDEGNAEAAAIMETARQQIRDEMFKRAGL